MSERASGILLWWVLPILTLHNRNLSLGTNKPLTHSPRHSDNWASLSEQLLSSSIYTGALRYKELGVFLAQGFHSSP